MASTAAVKMPGTPRPWMNTAMRVMLRTPGLRRILGKAFAVLTVTGSRTGHHYATPVQYFRYGPQYVVLSQRTRTWWRNIRRRPAVELLVQGTTIEAGALIAEAETAHAILAACLNENPRVAKFYGIDTEKTAAIGPADVDLLLERVVVILISPEVRE